MLELHIIAKNIRYQSLGHIASSHNRLIAGLIGQVWGLLRLPLGKINLRGFARCYQWQYGSYRVTIPPLHQT